MSAQTTNIPLPIAPLAGPDGRISEIWWRFFLELFNRTGGTSGNEGTVEAIYPDVPALALDPSSLPQTFQDLIAPIPASDAPAFNDITAMLQAMGIGQALVEELYAPRLADPSLIEMLHTPIIPDAALPEMIFSPITTGSYAKVIADSPTSQTLLNLTSTDITNWTKRLDPGGNFNAVTGVFTASVADQYLICGNIDINSVAWTAVGQQANISVFKNGSSVGTCRTICQNATTMSINTGPIAQIVDLAVGDTMKFVVLQNSGNSTTTVSSISSRIMIAQLPR